MYFLHSKSKKIDIHKASIVMKGQKCRTKQHDLKAFMAFTNSQAGHLYTESKMHTPKITS